jgi:hypothetical protein
MAGFIVWLKSLFGKMTRRQPKNAAKVRVRFPEPWIGDFIVDVSNRGVILDVEEARKTSIGMVRQGLISSGLDLADPDDPAGMWVKRLDPAEMERRRAEVFSEMPGYVQFVAPEEWDDTFCTGAHHA